MIRIGLISDTHNLIRQQARAFLEGCDHIIHAGDIADARTLDEIRTWGAVTVVRGNNDQGDWASELPHTAQIEFGGVSILVIHDLKELTNPSMLGARVIVSGHSHKPLIREESGVIYVNPGSAGRRRFKLPVSVGDLLIEAGEVTARVVELDIEQS